jgi:hypothetical protein
VINTLKLRLEFVYTYTNTHQLSFKAFLYYVQGSEIVDFCGALIREFRGDWAGALDLFTSVLGNETGPTGSRVPTPIRIDAYLCMAAAAMMGNPARSVHYALEAYELDRFRKTTVQYLCLGYLAEMSGPGTPRQKRTEAAFGIPSFRAKR